MPWARGIPDRWVRNTPKVGMCAFFIPWKPNIYYLVPGICCSVRTRYTWYQQVYIYDVPRVLIVSIPCIVLGVGESNLVDYVLIILILRIVRVSNNSASCDTLLLATLLLLLSSLAVCISTHPPFVPSACVCSKRSYV